MRSKGEIEERRGTGFGWVEREEREKQGVGRKMMGEREKERDTACRDKWRGKDSNLAVVGSHEGLDSLGGLTQVVVGDLGEKVVDNVGSDVVVDLQKKEIPLLAAKPARDHSVYEASHRRVAVVNLPWEDWKLQGEFEKNHGVSCDAIIDMARHPPRRCHYKLGPQTLSTLRPKPTLLRMP